MPNDIPDWTGQHNVQHISTGGQFLGDVGAPVPAADSVTEQPSGGAPLSGAGVVASYKPGAGGVIAQVGATGAATLGTKLAVTPPFGQATTAGNLLVAKVTAPGASSEPTTVAVGWVKDKSTSLGNGWTQIWSRPNCGNAEAAPQFTCDGAGVNPMAAQAGEFSGAATVTPLEQTGSGSGAPPGFTVTTASKDANFGNLVVFVSRWYCASTATITFTDAYNNSAATVDDGVVNNLAALRQSHFSHAIIPAAKSALPLGVRPWDLDASGSAQPAGGSAASVVLAATPGKAYRAFSIDASMEESVATTAGIDVQILDGATIIWDQILGIPSGIGNAAHLERPQLALKGTVGNSMTAKFTAGVTSVTERINIGAYLQ